MTKGTLMLNLQTCSPPSCTDWVEAAQKLPLYFALVREDPEVDLAVSRMLPNGASAVMIASGGCTAAALAASGKFSRLHLVDANKGQILLSLLKLYMLCHMPPAQRMALLGHAPASAEERKDQLTAALHGTKLLFEATPAQASTLTQAHAQNQLLFALEELGPVGELCEHGPD